MNNWHQKIFPFVTLIIILFIGSFIAFGIFQFSRISNDLTAVQKIDTRLIIDKALNIDPKKINEGFETGAYIPQWASLVALESAALERRHHQANALLASRLWIRYLAVMAGIILIGVGSIFVLAKLNDSPTNIESESASIKVKMASASPGIIFSFLGCILILAAILHNPSIELKDGRVYMGNENQPIPGVAQ